MYTWVEVFSVYNNMYMYRKANKDLYYYYHVHAHVQDMDTDMETDTNRDRDTDRDGTWTWTWTTIADEATLSIYVEKMETMKRLFAFKIGNWSDEATLSLLNV